MVFGVPWLDGPTALASVVSCSGEAQLFTTVANPVVRWAGCLGQGAGCAGRDFWRAGRRGARPWFVRATTRALAMRLTSDGPASMSR
jgi:hypothetical protein